MTKLTLKALLIVAVAGTGVALKIGRYGAGAEDASGSALAHAARVMAAHGWVEAAQTDQSADTLYVQRTFRRAGCAQPVVVAVLAGNAEGAQFFRARHGGDAAFVQDSVVEQPSGLRRQLTGMSREMGRMLGMDLDRPLPVLAIAPAPGATADTCNGPPAAAWRRKAN